MLGTQPAFPEVQIVELPARTLVGPSVRTSMARASVDCTAIWQRLIPWMMQVHGVSSGFACPSFGVSTDADLSTGQFTYRATIEVCPAFQEPATWPQDFTSLTLAAGPYAGTRVSSLERLGEAYTHLYGPWVQQQPHHTIDMRGACFEYYDENYLNNGSFNVFVPLRAK